MAVKGGVKTLESGIAALIIFSFLAFIFSPVVHETSAVQKDFVEKMLKEALSSGFLESELASGNLTLVKEKLEEILPFEFEIGIEEYESEIFVCNSTTCVFHFNATKTCINTSYLDFFSPQMQEINITLNSYRIFSSTSTENYGINILPYLQEGANELSVEKSGTEYVALVIWFVKENFPQDIASAEQLTVISFPCYAKGVKKLYVFI